MTNLPANGDPEAADGRRPIERGIITRQWGTSRRHPPNYLSRREQYRLFVLSTSLMLVLVMMNEARKPANWRWLWAGEVPASQPNEPIDTRLDAKKRNLSHDAFLAVAQSATSAADANDLETDTLDAPGQTKFPPGITREMLSSIEDNTVLRVAENDAWYAMLAMLKESDSATLESYSLGYVGFAQLFQQSGVYRGQIVRTQGTAHRVEAIKTRSNRVGIEQLFRWIIQPAGPSNAPIVVYTIEKPDGFETGDGLREEVAFTGFFFKRWAYAASDGTRIAPLLLARNAQWQPRKPAARIEPPSAPTILLLLMGLSLVAGAIALWVYQSTRIHRPEIERIRAADRKKDVQFDASDVLPSVSESLNRIAGRYTDEGDAQ